MLKKDAKKEDKLKALRTAIAAHKQYAVEVCFYFFFYI